MWSAPQVCRACKQPAVRGTFYCAKHTEAPPPSQRVRDAVDKMYDTARWATFRAWMLMQNPICQRIVKGEQCHNPSSVVHHLISPRQRPDLFTDPRAVTCLCPTCHDASEGTPTWRPGVDFVPTRFSPPSLSFP